MREGYEKYSDGSWRRVYRFTNGHVMMIIRDGKENWIRTVRGKKAVVIELAKVKKLNSDDEQKANPVAPQASVPVRLTSEDSVSSKHPHD